MEAKVLMINDWVQQQNCTTPSQVAGVNGNKIYTYWADNTKHAKDAYYFDPIPLTAEILEKNGFKTDNYHTLTGSCIYYRLCGKDNDYEVVVRLLNGWIAIKCFDERWHDLLNVHFQPRYVHELQHALRLCGLNDLADNFEV